MTWGDGAAVATAGAGRGTGTTAGGVDAMEATCERATAVGVAATEAEAEIRAADGFGVGDFDRAGVWAYVPDRASVGTLVP